jgi:hypothetical protein
MDTIADLGFVVIKLSDHGHVLLVPKLKSDVIVNIRLARGVY